MSYNLRIYGLAIKYLCNALFWIPRDIPLANCIFSVLNHLKADMVYHSKLIMWHQFLFSHHLFSWQCVDIVTGNEALIIHIPTCCTICSDRSLQSLQTEKEHGQNPRIKLNCYLGKPTKFSDKTSFVIDWSTVQRNRDNTNLHASFSYVSFR